jgi:uncharacterized DUF497 family protein
VALSQPLTYTARVKLSWDQAKSRENQRKHGISFEEAGELFSSGVDYVATSIQSSRIASSPSAR